MVLLAVLQRESMVDVMTKEKDQDLYDAIVDTLNRFDREVNIRLMYRGRGMFSAEGCLGIVGNADRIMFALGFMLGEAEAEEANFPESVSWFDKYRADEWLNSNRDQMAMEHIVYWPRIQLDQSINQFDDPDA